MCIKERKRTDREYASYIDYKTIGLLFCLMTVMAGLQSLGVFKKAGERLLGYVKGPGAVSAVVVLQTIAANLGSMLTPIGNPQNLYLYSKAGLSAGRFMELMAPYTAVSLGMLGICLAVAAVRNRMPEKEINGGGQGPVSGCGLFPSPDVLRVFVFIGNMGRVPAFCRFLGRILEGREIITCVGASQVISNVPAALLLSGFSGDYSALIVGTNLAVLLVLALWVIPF
uniref:SLC13 family permease n=3 Tax=Enterocloster clostridioformis TaxID=1531 RepID=UPI0025A54273|nr:SLC13 family permease [Enterocloster clostridioformis]